MSIDTMQTLFTCLLFSLAACDSFWNGLLRDRSQPCIAADPSCPSGQSCSADTGLCVASDDAGLGGDSDMGGGDMGGGGDMSAMPSPLPAANIQPVCPNANFCWEHPLPQGNTLSSVWATSENDVWAVGDVGTILHYNGTRWSQIESGTTDSLLGVWGADANNVWAITSQQILRWNGTRFNNEEPVPVGFSFVGITGTSASSVWVTAGDDSTFPQQGYLLSYDGVAWDPQMQDPPLLQLSAQADGSLWAISCIDDGGLDCDIRKRTPGGSWTVSLSLGPTQPNQLRTVGNNQVWVVESENTLRRFDGTSWSMHSAPVSTVLRDVWGRSPSDIWAVGFDENNAGTALHWNGSALAAPVTVGPRRLLGISGAGGSSFWVVGLNGEMQRSNGVAWQSWNLRVTTETLSGVWSIDSNNVWAVGDAQTILKRTNGQWVKQYSSTVGTDFFVSMVGVSATQLWAMGKSGVTSGLASGNGTSWTVTQPGAGCFFGSWVKDINNGWAVTQCGHFSIWRLTGGTWGEFQTTPDYYMGVWGFDANNAWAVGASGKILKWSSGGTWGAQTSGTTRNLNAVWGSSVDNVFAVGENGVIRRYNGSNWENESSGLSKELMAIKGNIGNLANIWACGFGGTIIKRPIFGSWSVVPQVTDRTLRGMWGDTPGTIWFVGDGGTILRYQP